MPRLSPETHTKLLALVGLLGPGGAQNRLYAWTEIGLVRREMGKQDRLLWLLFGGSMLVVVGWVVAVKSPQAYVTYCTSDFSTCIERGKSAPWRVLDPPCPAGQSLRVLSGYRCHSISVSGLATPLRVCPATCAK